MSGGQYSLFRGALGLGLIGFFGWPVLHQPVSVLTQSLISGFGPSGLLVVRACAVVLALLIIIGWRDRLAAFVMFFLVPLSGQGLLLHPIAHPLAFLLLIHVFVPSAPYGSLDAAGRPDPAGDWRLPASVQPILWVFLGAMFLTSLASALRAELSPSATAVCALGSLACLLALHPSWRVGSFFLLALLVPYLYLHQEPEFVGLMLLLLAVFDPAWLPPHPQNESEILFYDGECGLCHRACRFVLAEDRDGSLFRFAPLQSETFTTRLSAEQRAGLPDSLVLLTSDQRVLTRSSAVLHLGLRLGGLWRPLAQVALVVPRPVRDWVYAAIAAVRSRIFTAPKQLCPILPPHLRARFLY